MEGWLAGLPSFKGITLTKESLTATTQAKVVVPGMTLRGDAWRKTNEYVKAFAFIHICHIGSHSHLATARH